MWVEINSLIEQKITSTTTTPTNKEQQQKNYTKEVMNQEVMNNTIAHHLLNRAHPYSEQQLLANFPPDLNAVIS